MAYYFIEDNILTDIANSIRYKTDTTSKYTPESMGAAINNIQTGGGINIGDNSIVIDNGTVLVGDDIIDMSYYFNSSFLPIVNAGCGNSVTSMYYTYWNTKIVNAACGPNVLNMYFTYSYCNNLTSAECGPNVKYMDYTYSVCNYLESAVCGENVIEMNYTYNSCNNLINAACGNNVINMYYTYSNCRNLKNAVCGNNVIRMIGSYYNCANLINAVCGLNVNSMAYTYYNCISLQDAVCGDNVINMRSTYQNCFNLINAVCGLNVNNMFFTYHNCRKLINAVCGDNVQEMASTYYNCTSLKTGICGPKVKNMNLTYYGCNNLQTVSMLSPILENLTETFSHCSNLKTIEVPSSVVRLYRAFFNCVNLTNVSINCLNAVNIVQMAIYSNFSNSTVYFPSATECTSAFSESQYDQEIYIPDKLNNGNMMYYSCKKAWGNNIHIRQGYNLLNMFRNVSNIYGNVYIYGSTFVRYATYGMFVNRNTSNALNIYFRDYDNAGIFFRNQNTYSTSSGTLTLTQPYEDNPDILYNSQWNVYFYINAIENTPKAFNYSDDIINCAQLFNKYNKVLQGEVFIPSRAENIDHMYSSCANLTGGFNIPGTVKIASSAFSGCSNLNGIVRFNVTSLTNAYMAFSSCQNLQAIHIESDYDSLPKNTNMQLMQTNLYIPNSIKELKMNVDLADWNYVSSSYSKNGIFCVYDYMNHICYDGNITRNGEDYYPTLNAEYPGKITPCEEDPDNPGFCKYCHRQL